MTLIRVDNATAEQVEPYLPRNYKVLEVFSDNNTVYVSGEDNAGWTALGYVIPRLASGMLWASVVTVADIRARERERFRAQQAAKRGEK